jgi:TonB family protein
VRRRNEPYSDILAAVPNVVLALVLLAVVRGPALAQQLTFQTHTEVRTLRPDSVDSQLDTFSDHAGLELRQVVLAPIEGGPADSTITISDGAIRVEHLRDGTVEIIRNDQDTAVLNTANKTYWASPNRRPATSLPGLSARLSWKRTGESEVIAGVQAEQILFEIAMLPADQRFAKTLGEPVMFRAQGEVWAAAQYGRYAQMAAAVAPKALSMFPTLAELAEHGVIMRSIITSELLGPVEIESVVTRISEGPPDPSLYHVPSGYRRVSSPPPEGFEPPQLISRSPANYPAEAARGKIDGDVLLLVTIAADGSVRNPRVLKGLGYGLDEEAVASVRRWRYKPARKNGQPIDSQLTISVGFTFREQSR